MKNQDNKEDFCRLLFENNAVYFAGEKDLADFKVKSGRKSPYFVNFGALDSGQAIEELGKYFADAINAILEKVGTERPITIFGPAYKGIPLCVTTAIALPRKIKDVFFCFDRKEAKDHGEGGLFVGRTPKKDDKIVIVDDVLTSGLSINHSIDLLTKGTKIKPKNIYVVVGVDRMEVGQSGKKLARVEIEERLGKEIKCIVDINDLLKVGEEENFLKKENIEQIENYLTEIKKELKEG